MMYYYTIEIITEKYKSFFGSLMSGKDYGSYYVAEFFMKNDLSERIATARNYLAFRCSIIDNYGNIHYTNKSFNFDNLIYKTL